MAYAAVISLKHTIQRLSKSPHISIVGNSIPQIMQKISSLEQALKSLDKRVYSSNVERVNALDAQIRDAVFELEDVIETHISNLFLARGDQDDDPRSLLLSVDLQDLKRDLDSITERLKEMKKAYIEQVINPSPEQEEEQVNDPMRRPAEKKSKMVGLSSFRSEVRELFITVAYGRTVSVSIVGTAGLGKTALARETFDDPEIADQFECRAWVTVGPKYQLNQIIRTISAQVNDQITDKEEIAAYFMERRYLVVFDDVWNSQLDRDWKTFLPENGKGNKVMITTRIYRVHCTASISMHEFPFLNKEESWQLLREKVFGEDGYCPRQLEKSGKKIAQNCEGLPLTILEVAKILSEADKTVEFWNTVAEKQNYVFSDAYDQMLKVLYPSYYYLPQFSKACFLYMGVFPQEYELPLSKIINLWSAEGFLEPSPSGDLEVFVTKCLDEFRNGNVIVVSQKIESWGPKREQFNNRKYHVHSALLHLCVSEARNIKFYRVLNRYNEDAAHGIDGQRRFCIRNNVLFSIKDMYELMTSISNARSLLCTGPYHQYPVPICFGLSLLRVLDALTIRFYEFPVEVVKLIQLRYLAVTYDGKLPICISKLFNLESLIVNQHVSIKFSIAPLYLPLEIWDMQELKHLQVTGYDLPEPSEGSMLPNLLTLLDVSAHSCTKRVLARTPNLKKLGIRIISAESNATEPFRFFYQMPHLHGLEKLKYIFTSPILPSDQVVDRPPRALPIFPSRLTRLTLGGVGYPWEEMRVIASLPNLEVLRLRCYAFRGPIWETHGKSFPKLFYLSIQDSDLVVWIIGEDSFPKLAHLKIEHCYKLQEIRGDLRCINKIEAVDSNPLGVAFAEQIANHGFCVKFTSRWEAEQH